jgi:hypothetical protein
MDFGCLYYAIISKKHATRFNLSRIDIFSRIMEGFEKRNITTTIISIIYANININGYE